MKKILLSAINSKYIHSSPAVYCLKAAADMFLPESKFETKIFEGTINDTVDHLLYSITEYEPDIIGFAVYIWNIDVVTKLCKSLKSALPNCKIILGGPEVSYGISHTAICEDDYDYIVSGEGEIAFPAAVYIAEGLNVPEHLEATQTERIVSAKPIQSLDDLPFIYTKENINCLKNRIVYYESSRGCPFSCAYCLSSVCGKVRFLSLERVFSDLDFFIDNNIPQVKFVDRTFNCSSERAYKIWEYILKRSSDSKTNFHFEIGADLIEERHIELLKKMPAGKVQLEAGIQSTNEESLKESCRVASVEKIFKNLSALIEQGNINIHTDLIAGLPYENYQRFAKSFNDVYALRSHQLQLGFLKLLSGAPLNNVIKKHGYSFSEYIPYELIKNNCLSYNDIKRLKEVEDVVERFYNSGRFVLSLQALEKLFSSPFEMYEIIADFLKEKGMLFAGVSTKKLYDVLDEFSKKYCLNISCILLEDFYLSENSEVVPESLKHLLPLNKFAKPVSSKLLKDLDLSKDKKNLVKFIKNKAFVIDYSERNPVNSRYKISACKEVIFDEQ